eukprot:64740-Amorphochlora_amoeboformis.AAC.2
MAFQSLRNGSRASATDSPELQKLFFTVLYNAPKESKKFRTSGFTDPKTAKMCLVAVEGVSLTLRSLLFLSSPSVFGTQENLIRGGSTGHPLLPILDYPLSSIPEDMFNESLKFNVSDAEVDRVDEMLTKEAERRFQIVEEPR